MNKFIEIRFYFELGVIFESLVKGKEGVEWIGVAVGVFVVWSDRFMGWVILEKMEFVV